MLRLGVCRKTGPWVVALNAGGENKNENHGTIFLALNFSFFFPPILTREFHFIVVLCFCVASFLFIFFS